MWLFVASVVCLILGVYPYLYRLYIRINGALLHATVVSYYEKGSISSGNNHHSFYAVLSYQVNGVKYQTKKAVQIPKRSFDGGFVVIYFLKNNPEKIITKGYNMIGKSNHLIFILLSIMFFSPDLLFIPDGLTY